MEPGTELYTSLLDPGVIELVRLLLALVVGVDVALAALGVDV